MAIPHSIAQSIPQSPNSPTHHSQDLTTLLEDSFSYISLHSPSLTFPSFVSLFTSLDLAFKVAGPDGSLSFHVNSYMVHDNDRNADLDGGVPGKLRVLYDCRDIVVSTQAGKGVRMAATPPRFETSELGSDPVITVPTPPSSYSAPFDYFLCRRYGELEMSARRWMAAMMWYRAGEYNALRSRAAGDGDARPGVDKHAQAACLRMMGEVRINKRRFNPVGHFKGRSLSFKMPAGVKAGAKTSLDSPGSHPYLMKRSPKIYPPPQAHNCNPHPPQRNLANERFVAALVGS